ncbi:MAG: hypothetical protein AB1505_34930 [Candidatus Latescibacterota bacterium]
MTVRLLDVKLLGLAVHHGGRLATLDRGIASLLPAHGPWRDALEVVPAARTA